MRYRGAEMTRACSWLLPLPLLLACQTTPATTGETGASETGSGDATVDPTTTTATTGKPGPVTTDTGDAPTTGADTGGDAPEPPDLQCPGDKSGSCDLDPSAKLEAGAAVLSIVPNCYEEWTDLDNNFAFKKGNDELLDCGCDRLCPEDPGYLGPDDGEGDGKLQAAWMAGFGNGRPANGVRGEGVGLVGDGDGLWARAIVLRQGNTTVAIVAMDLVGWFNGDVKAARQQLAEQGLEVDHLIVHSTHTHEGPDSMGLWGVDQFTSGYDPKLRAQLRVTVVDAVETAFKELRPVAALKVGEVDISTYHDNGVANVISDHRDPWVVDEFISAARLTDSDGQTIATLINFSCHPETLSDENLLMTSDFVHALRRTVEQGSTWKTAPGTPGLGGPAIYINGAVGGMMTTLGVNVTNPDGDSFQSASWEKADSIGQLLGEMALDAVANGDDVVDPSLRVINKVFRAPVDNGLFKFLFMQGIVEREVFENPRTKDMEIDTEMSLVELGPIQMLSVPGELLPELAVGGYDGSRINAPGVPLIDPNNPNPPKIDQAPAGPYIKDRMPGMYPWLIGLGNDELGYIIPEYNFELAPGKPYTEEAEGDHYEETNSLGPHMAGLVDKYADLLIYWSKQSR
jgi:hypothetical protein